jgi:phosphopantetheinyl transferase (holo-ACP synthase)
VSFEETYIKSDTQIEDLIINNEIHVSLSHDLDIATAIVIIQNKINLNNYI